MKPDGSIRRTRASSVLSPPHCSIIARAPGLTRTASVDSRSATISSRCGSPISSSGSPAGTTLSLSRTRLSTTPSDRRGHGHDAARRVGRRRREPRLRALQLRGRRPDGERRGIDRLLGDPRPRPRAPRAPARDQRRPAPARGRASARAAPAPASPARAALPRAPGRAPPSRSRPRPALRRASARRAAAAPRRARARRPGRASPRSPGSSSMRSTRPATGAETTNRSRTRVIPSSSIGDDERPARDRGHVHRRAVVGHSATASSPPTTAERDNQTARRAIRIRASRPHRELRSILHRVTRAS